MFSFKVKTQKEGLGCLHVDEKCNRIKTKTIIINVIFIALYYQPVLRINVKYSQIKQWFSNDLYTVLSKADKPVYILN